MNIPQNVKDKFEDGVGMARTRYAGPFSVDNSH